MNVRRNYIFAGLDIPGIKTARQKMNMKKRRVGKYREQNFRRSCLFRLDVRIIISLRVQKCRFSLFDSHLVNSISS